MGYIRQNVFFSAGQSVWYVLEVISPKYLLSLGVFRDHWFADETPSRLRSPTSCFRLVILTSEWLNHLCISFSLATHFSRRSKVIPLRFRFLWIATWLRMARKTCTRYSCLDLLKLRATHAGTQGLRGCGTEERAIHHTSPPTTSSLY